MYSSNRDNLNQPFEFEEVLLTRHDRGHMHRAATAEKIFANENVRPSPLNPTVRRLSVRLRTINNACEASFSMLDGRPVTEVSLYGGRGDRQLLIGPYSAVKRLMRGVLPWDDRFELEIDLQKSAEKLQSELGHVDKFLADPEQFNTENLIKAARRQGEEKNRRARWSYAQEEQVRTAAGFSLTIDRLGEIRTYSIEMHKVLSQLVDMKKIVADSAWWWAWSPEFPIMQDRIKSLAQSYRERRNAFRPATGEHGRAARLQWMQDEGSSFRD